MTRLQQTGSGLGSDIILTLRVKDEATAGRLFRLLWATIQEFERRFSRFQPDSELSYVNEQAGKETAVSLEFKELLETAQQYQQTTGGLYNPLMLPALQRAGYVGSWPNAQKFDPALDFRGRHGEKGAIEIATTGSTITIPEESAVDFGGIGKGYLLDRLADILDTKHVKHYWLSLGGDIISSGFDNNDQPWRVAVAKAQTPQESLLVVSNTSGSHQAVATSGTTKRRGTNWHHLIDPRTGQPARTDVLTATVVSSSATEADVLAKCLAILGTNQVESFIAGHQLGGTVLQTADAEYRYGELA